MSGRWGPAWPAVAEALAGTSWSGAQPVREQREGGYSPTSRWIIERADGRRAFAKALARPHDTAIDAWFDAERRVCAARPGVMCPELHEAVDVRVGDACVSVLVLEDLSTARWAAPVTVADAMALRRALDELEQAPVPSGLRSVPATGDHADGGWHAVVASPVVLVELGLFSDAWIGRHGADLAVAAGALTFHGTGLVHGDLWRQNWCHADRGAVLVDWTGASRGNARLNHAWAEAGVRTAGGPAGCILDDRDPDHAAWAAHMAGLAAWFLAEDLPIVSTLPRLHATQAREAMATLVWACDALGIERPAFGPALVAHGPWQP